MTRDVIIYMSAFVGMSLLLGVFGGFICCRHLKHEQRQRQRVLCLQSLRQQAIDQDMPPLYVDHGRDPVYILMQEPSLDTTMIPLESVTTGVDTGIHDPPREINLCEVPAGNDRHEHDLVPDLTNQQIQTTLHFDDEDQQQETPRGSASLHSVSPPPYEST